MKKAFIIVGILFGLFFSVLILGFLMEKTDISYTMSPKEKVEYIKRSLDNCSDTIQMAVYFSMLDSIKLQGGEAAALVDSFNLYKEFVEMSVKMRYMEVYVEQAKKNIADQFDKTFGYHISLTDLIKNQLNDPDSFKHVGTRYSIGEGYRTIIVQETFRFKNIYGGVETTTVAARYTSDGQFVEFMK
jgi:hypothetical protein